MNIDIVGPVGGKCVMIKYSILKLTSVKNCNYVIYQISMIEKVYSPKLIVLI